MQLFFTITYIILSKMIPHALLRSVLLFFVLLLSFQILGNLYDYKMINKLSIFTVFIFNMNILFLIIGTWLSVLMTRKQIASSKNYLDTRPLLNINLLIVIQFLLLIISFFIYIKFSSIIASLPDTESVRSMYYETGVLFKTYTERFIYIYIVSGYKYIASFIFSYLFLKKNITKKEILLMIMSIVYVLMLATISQGRAVILIPIIFVYFYATFLKINYPVLYSGYVKTKLTLLLICSIVAIGFISLMRVKADVSLDNLLANLEEALIYPIIDYFSFPLTAFEYAINNIFSNTPLMFGMATLAGFEELLLTPFLYIDKSIETTNSFLGVPMSSFYNINGEMWNALYTGVINYYLDFSIFGVMLFPLILGYILGKLSMYIQKKDNIFNMIIYLFFLYCLFKNLSSSPFQSLEIWIALVLILSLRKIFIKKINFRIKNTF